MPGSLQGTDQGISTSFAIVPPFCEACLSVAFPGPLDEPADPDRAQAGDAGVELEVGRVALDGVDLAGVLVEQAAAGEDGQAGAFDR